MPTSADRSPATLIIARSPTVDTAAPASGRRSPAARKPRSAKPPEPAVEPAGEPEDPNVVRLLGRLGADPIDKELPSGDHIVTWRVIVEQPAPTRRAGPRSRVDTIDCIGWSARVRRTAMSLAEGDRVCVQGSLRRRFWQTGSGPASRYEVEVTALRRDRDRTGQPPQ